jgi:hypothetical protein
MCELLQSYPHQHLFFRVFHLGLLPTDTIFFSYFLEEMVRFELTDPYESPDFKSGAFGRSATFPVLP